MSAGVTSLSAENILLQALSMPASRDVDVSKLPEADKSPTGKDVEKARRVARAILDTCAGLYDMVESDLKGRVKEGFPVSYAQAQLLQREYSTDSAGPSRMISSVDKLVLCLGVLAMSREGQALDARRDTDALLRQYAATRAKAHFFERAYCYSGASLAQLLEKYKNAPTKTMDQVRRILAELEDMTLLHMGEAPSSWQAFLRPLLEELMDTVGDFPWKGDTLATAVYNYAIAAVNAAPPVEDLFFIVGDAAWRENLLNMLAYSCAMTPRETAFVNLRTLLQGIKQVATELSAAQAPAK